MNLGYIDPSSGSMLLQGILGGLAAAAGALKLFWHRVLVFLHIRKPDEGQAAEAHEADDAVPSEREPVAKP
jgi:hypothetical protein